LAEFRELLKAEGFTERLDDATLLRFLRARKFNLEASKLMFTESEKWRKEFGTDELLDSFKYDEKPLVSAYYPQYYHKTDIDGRPVYIEQFGKIDLSKLYQITTEERMMKNLIFEYEMYAVERLPACSRKVGCLVETSCTILDLKGVSISQVPSTYGYLKRASAYSQNYYPERMGKLYVINAPWGFSTIWSFIKGWLDPVTVDKVHILGSGYKKELLQQIPAENLPVHLGGECRCAEGCELSDAGPWKDEEWKNSTWNEKAASATQGELQNEWNEAYIKAKAEKSAYKAKRM